jgi:hypothetical protein
MESIIEYPCTMFSMAPPCFEKNNFYLWTIKMKCFLKTLGRDVFDSISNEFKINEWSSIAYDSFEADSKARFAIMHALKDDISCISSCTSAFAMWNLLISKFGTNHIVSSPCMSMENPTINEKNKRKKEKKKEKKKKKKREEKEIQEVEMDSSSDCLEPQDISSCEVISQPSSIIENICFSSFNDDFISLKCRMDSLHNTLSECASHSLKLESLYCKNENLKNDCVHPKQHKRVYHCKCCGRDGHIALFCYNNVANIHSRGQNPNLIVHKACRVKTQPFAPLVWVRPMAQS